MKWKEHEDRRNTLDARRQRVTGNPNKIKKNFLVYWQDASVLYSWNDRSGWWSNDTISFYFRSIRTHQEHKINVGHCKDYGECLVRGHRRSQLPDSWDDLQNSSWGHQKSWKKHSKRRHQWKIQ